VFFQRDVQLLWLTHVETLVRAAADGVWPVWNPFLAFGQPLWADANAQIAYPLTWLNLVVRPWHYYTLYVVAHALLGAAGIYALGRRLELSRGAAMAAGAVWMAAGPTVSTAPMWNQLAGAAWLPWSVLAAEAALDTGRVADALLWGAALAAPILAGSPEGALMAAVLGAAVALTRVLGRAPRPTLRRAIASIALACAFALALSAVQWLPSLEAARRSARVGLTPEGRAYWSVHPIALLQTLFPVLVDAAGLRADRAAMLSESREPFFASLYLGLGATGLVLAAWVGPPRRHRTFLAVAAVAGALMALGRHTPLYAWAEALLPPLQALRYPAKTMALVAFAWSLLAGMGVDGWRSLEAQPRRFRGCVLVPLAALTLAAGWMAVLLFRDPDVWGARVFANPASGLGFADLLAPTRLRLVAATVASGAVLAIGVIGTRFSAPSRGAAVAFCAVADLLVAHYSLNPAAPPGLYTHRPELLDVVRGGLGGPQSPPRSNSERGFIPRGGLGGPESPPSSDSERGFIPRERNDGQRIHVYDYFFDGRSERHLGRAAPYLVARAPAGWPVRAAQALGMRMYLFPPSAGPWGVEGSYDLDVPGLGSPYVAALGELLRAAEGTPAHLRLLRLGAVSHVVALHDAGFESLERVALVGSLFPEPIRVFRVPDARPRTYAVGGAQVADGPAALRTLFDPAFDPAREVVLAGGPAAPARPSFSGTSRVVSRAADRVRLEADLSGDGYVVLVDAWDPAWRVSVDGRPADLLRANVAFQAVAVPGGRHVIDLRYRPAALPWGLALTGLAVAAGVAVYFRNSSPRRMGSVGPDPTSSTLPPGPTRTVMGTRATLKGRLNSRFGARTTGNETGTARKKPGGSRSSITPITFTPGARRS
jgi:hypothetical protein